MAVLRVGPLPEGALEAAARFYDEMLPQAMAMLASNPPRDGEGDRPQDGGGGPPQTLRQTANPLRQRSALPPPRSGEDLVLIFAPAPYDHRGWRLAAVQDLARAAAPVRVNGIVTYDEDAIAETLAFLETAPGVTGQLLAAG